MSRLRLRQLDEPPVHRVRVLNARRGGGRESAFVPVLRGTVDGLPASLDGLILTSDLQGRTPGAFELAGLAVIEALAGLAGVPPLSRCGAVLAGDLYTVPDATTRGGFGDVAPVWQAFAEHCAWVTGVAGNHDDVRALPSDVTLLDAAVETFEGLRIGGVGLISGEANKPGRRAEADQLAAIALVDEQRPDLLVLHQGPPGDGQQPGDARLVIESPFVVCGHVHWPQPVFRSATQVVLNVDSRVVVLTS